MSRLKEQNMSLQKHRNIEGHFSDEDRVNGVRRTPVRFVKLPCHLYCTAVQWCLCRTSWKSIALFCPVRTESHCANGPCWPLWLYILVALLEFWKSGSCLLLLGLIRPLKTLELLTKFTNVFNPVPFWESFCKRQKANRYFSWSKGMHYNNSEQQLGRLLHQSSSWLPNNWNNSTANHSALS